MGKMLYRVSRTYSEERCTVELRQINLARLTVRCQQVQYQYLAPPYCTGTVPAGTRILLELRTASYAYRHKYIKIIITGRQRLFDLPVSWYVTWIAIVKHTINVIYLIKKNVTNTVKEQTLELWLSKMYGHSTQSQHRRNIFWYNL